jgi:hypothetical protein
LLDQLTIQLFFPFQREVGRKRLRVYNYNEFEKYVEETDGIDDCYASVYPLSKNIDRIVFDFDGLSSLYDAKKVFNWTIQKGIPSVPIITGRKGFQIHLLFKPSFMSSSSLKIITRRIIKDIFGEQKNSIDTHLVGNTSALCRIPNTLRPPENRTFATYLPKNFVNETEYDVFEHSKRKNVYDYAISHDYDITKEYGSLVYENDIDYSDKYLKSNIPPAETIIKPKDTIAFLSRLLTNKEIEDITFINPENRTRVRITIKLLDLGLHPEEIIYLYSNLSWADFNKKVTSYYVYQIASKYYDGTYKYSFLNTKIKK